MKKLIAILAVCICSCQQPKPKEIPAPLPMSLAYPTYVSTTTFNALQTQVISLSSQLTDANTLIANLKSKVLINQSSMYAYANEFYTRTDMLDSLRKIKDTITVDPLLGKMVINSVHNMTITKP